MFSGYINASSAATAAPNFISISDSDDLTNTPSLRRSNNNSSTPKSGSTIKSDQTSTKIEFGKNLDDFILEILRQLQLDYLVPDTPIMVTMQNTIDVVNDMMDWIKGASKTDLLRKPFINVINER